MTSEQASISDTAEQVDANAGVSPYDLPGAWYVINTYSAYEKKVKTDLTTRLRTMHLEGRIYDIVIPVTEVVEYVQGKKRTVEQKTFPGYILIRMVMDDDTWFVVRNTYGVTGFVGANSTGGTKPVSLSRREVEKFLGTGKVEKAKKAAKVDIGFKVGDAVKVVTGPFADFEGFVESVDHEAGKLRVLVDIFGRETPVELQVDQVLAG